MKKVKILSLLTFLIGFLFVLHYFKTFSATACSATADNGSNCSITCNEGIATCVAGAKSVLCYCKTVEAPQQGGQFQLTSFAPGERDYFTNQLKPFIMSLNSPRAEALANALDQVITAVDIMNADLYNQAEWNYHQKRSELNDSEREALDNWVSQNAFYR